MLGDSLKDWLLRNPERQWALQVIVDTLALGENIPARLVSFSYLDNLYGLLISLHSGSQHDSGCPANPFTDRFPQQEDFDHWVAAELDHISQACHGIASASYPNVGYAPLPDLIQDISRHIFITLTSNELPIENLLRVELPQWEWLQVICLYSQIKARQPTDSQAFCIRQFQVKIDTMNIDICRQQEGIDSPSERLGLMVGPLIFNEEALFAEEAYDQYVVEPIIEALRNIFTHYKNRNNFSFTRIHKAIQAEPVCLSR